MMNDDLPGDVKGSSNGAPWLNKLNAAVRRRSILPGAGYGVERTNSGTFLKITPGAGRGTTGTTYRVKSANGDYLVCRTWDGTTEGASDVKVAKPFDARQIAGETLGGVDFTYSGYTAAALNSERVAAFSGGPETQQVTPLWKVDGLIHVAAINFSGVTADGADLKLIEVSSRCWAKIA